MQQFLFQKINGQMILLGHHDREFHEWVETLEDKECYEATFVGVGSTKTNEQLGYFFGSIVPDVIAGLKHLGWDEVGTRDVLGTQVPMAVNVENVDYLLKLVYSIEFGAPIPSKAKMSVETMTRFIDCVRRWAHTNGIPTHDSEDY